MFDFFQWGNRTLLVWDSKLSGRKFREVLKFGPRAISIGCSCCVLASFCDFPCWAITYFLARVEAPTICKRHSSWFIHFVLNTDSGLKMRCLRLYLLSFTCKWIRAKIIQFATPALLGDFLRWPSTYFLAFFFCSNYFVPINFFKLMEIVDCNNDFLCIFTRKRMAFRCGQKYDNQIKKSKIIFLSETRNCIPSFEK